MSLQTSDTRPAPTPPPAHREPGDRSRKRDPDVRDQRLRPADPDRADRLGTMPAGTVLLVIVGALTIAAVLNAGPMLERARASELGAGRDVRLGFWEPVAAFSSTLGLDLPRAALDSLDDSDGPGSGADGTAIVATGAPRGRLGHEPLEVAPAAPTTDGAAVGTTTTDGTGDDPADGPLAEPADNGGEVTGGSGATATPLGLPASAAPTGDADSASVDAAGTDPAGRDDDPTVAGRTDQLDQDPEVDPAGQPVDAASPPAATSPSPAPPEADDPNVAPPGRAASTNPAVAGSVAILGHRAGFRRPTVDDPLRVLLVGDSTMDAVGTATLRQLSATGVTDARLDYRVSTGLSRPDYFDWPAHLRELRAAEQPEVIVVMLGANDAQPILVEGEVEQHGTERWSNAYRQRVAALLDELTTGPTWVIWIGQPVMRNDPYDSRLRGLNDIVASETARYPNAVYLDPRPLTSDVDGGFTAYLPDADGNQQLIRQTDGVHFTPDGGERVAPAVVAEIDRVAPLQ